MARQIENLVKAFTIDADARHRAFGVATTMHQQWGLRCTVPIDMIPWAHLYTKTRHLDKVLKGVTGVERAFRAFCSDADQPWCAMQIADGKCARHNAKD